MYSTEAGAWKGRSSRAPRQRTRSRPGFGRALRSTRGSRSLTRFSIEANGLESELPWGSINYTTHILQHNIYSYTSNIG